jgi:hypothetical protein
VARGTRGIADLAPGLPKTRSALAYAERLHAGQTRAVDGAPFILHPIEVGTLLYRAGAPDHVIAAGALHDTIGKTDAGPTELNARFGAAVATLVLAVSEDPTIRSYEARKAALRQQVADAGADALMVFAADKISKVRELRLERAKLSSDSPGSAPKREHLRHYQSCLEMLEDRLGDSPLVQQLAIELGRVTAPRLPYAALAATV